jgi:hypothetical protein
MFSNSKEQSPKASENPSVDESSLVIHTMKDDLESLKNPNYQKTNPTPTPTNLPIDKKEEPFLSQSNWNEKKADFQKDKQVLEKSTNEKSGIIGKLLIWGLVIFIFLAIGSGGYYFWLTRSQKQTKTDNIPAIPVTNTNTSTEEQTQTQNTEEFSTVSPNYLSVDIENTDSTGLKNALKNYTDKVVASGSNKPTEFLITDSQNNPVSFQVFSQRLGLTLPANILSAIAPDFSFFIYNDNGNGRFGLNLKISGNTNQFKTNLTKAEQDLTLSLKPFYVPTDFTLNNAPFKSSTYSGNAIRYLNINSPQPLSVDYTIKDSQWIIGTSQMTLHSILDYLAAQTQ